VNRLKQIALALLLVSCIAGAYKVDQLERRVEAQGEIIAGYEARTEDVLQNWDQMRSTQLVLLEMMEGR